VIAVGRRGVLALGLALGLLTGWSVASQSPRVAAHSQLVTSVPGAGVVLPVAPPELRLVFSEPLEDDFTSLELLDFWGATISVDPHVSSADRRVLVASLASLQDGAYTVNWTALSAADGHVTAGFISFEIGNPVFASPGHFDHSGLGRLEGLPESGSIHAGHTRVDATIENLSRGVADAGFMLAFGLFVIGVVVVRPGLPGARGSVPVQIGALAVGTVGALVLLSFAGSAANLDALTYATGSRTGMFVGGRIVAGALLTIIATIAWASGRVRFAALVAALGGAAGILTIALGGHASAVSGQAAVAAIVVHIGAAAIWLSGLVAFAFLGLSRQLTGATLRAAVPRFSAVALIAIGLVVVTGGYSAWTQTRDLTPLLTSYATVLDVKVVVVGLALVLGFLNLIDGGRDRGPLRGFHGRIRVEAILGLIIVGLSATLVSGSPPGTNAPIWIERAASTARSVAATLALEPGRPGPNRLLVQLEAAVPDGGGVEIRLVQLDGFAGSSTIHLRPTQGDRDFVADGVVLGPESRWDAALVVRDAAATEIGRARFAWTLAAAGISEGRSAPIVDPTLVAAALLLGAALLGIAFTIAGGRLPLVHPTVGRQTLIAGGAIGAALGLILLVARGPG